MSEAGQKFVGEHDFRNFCTMDVANGVVNYKRKIFSVDIKQIFFRYEFVSVFLLFYFVFMRA